MHIIKSFLSALLTASILNTSIKLTKKLKYPQLRLKKIIKSVNTSTEKTSLNALLISLGGRIGVGSIAGITLAIYIAGEGTIFWIIIFAILSSSLSYSETLLALKYKTQTTSPSNYIKNGLHKKNLSKIYSILIIITYQLGFIPIQTNTIVKTLNINSPLLPGLLLAIIIYLSVKKGYKTITKITNKIVPLMTLLYILIGIYITIKNINIIPEIIIKIIKKAFKIKPFLTSFIPTILIGLQKGIFANEAGLGINALSLNNIKTNKNPGYIQILGVYITTFIICLSTSIIILTSKYQTINIINPNGIEITKYAFKYHLHSLGSITLNTIILLFALSTILSGHYYCQTSTKYLNKKIPLNITTPISAFLGSVTNPTLIWTSLDILIGLIGLINIYSLNKLEKQIVTEHKKYDRI